jgi:hypothetical protein
MIADLTWDAPQIYAAPNAAERYSAWWSHEYFGSRPGMALATETAYEKYFAILNTPDKFWTAPDAIEELLDRLYRKVAGEPYQAMNADTLGLMQARQRQLDDALAAEARAEKGMSLSEQRFLSIDAGLGLEVAARQTEAALKLEEALRAPEAARMWSLVLEARASLEQLEAILERGEYPPFDRWYQESWIRSAVSPNNPHRPYKQVRAFIASEGHGSLVRGRPF